MARDDDAMVLVADDDATIRALVCEALEDAGFRVVAARDGVAALEEVERDGIDLVLTDFDMPRLDGVALCWELRKRHENRAIPVVLMSAAHNEPATRSACADGFLAKPFSLDALEAMVRRTLAASGS